VITVKASKLSIGMRISGKRIQRIERLSAGWNVTFSDGSTWLYGRAEVVSGVQSVPDMSAGPVRSRPMASAFRVRASDGVWRGESDGKKGERFLTRADGYDRRALTERKVTR
jgi:hypothetical protein